MSLEPEGSARFRQGAAASSDRGVTLALAHPTVLDVLEAIAAAHGQLSWLVRYDDAEAGVADATISMMSMGTFAVASSARAASVMARVRERLLVPIRRSPDMMLSMYTRRARVHAGIELLDAVARDPVVDAPPLDLTDLPADIAIARIVALDSRYEWEDAGGVFNIRPRPDHGTRPSWLDQRVETFSVSDATVEDLFDAIAELLRARTAGSGSSEAGVPGLDENEQQRRIIDGRTKRISLTLANITVREVLNAICRTHGTLSWSVRRQPTRAAARADVIDFESFDGWSLSRTLTLP